MQIDATTKKALREGIVSAYPGVGQLEILVHDVLGQNLATISALNNPLPKIVFDIFVWCEAKGRLVEFLLGAAESNTGNLELNAAMKQLRAGSSQPSLKQWKQLKEDLGQEGPERSILASVPFQDIARWIEKLSATRRAICRVEPQQEDKEGYGTGFLVAPDIVMTNCHVIDGFKDPNKVRFRFDYEASKDGVSVGTGREVKLAENWNLFSSPANELDFALVRLVEKVGDDSFTGGTRGVLQLKENHKFEVGQPLLILQHPDAKPLQLAIGSISEPNPRSDRVVYNTNTEPGSSGSPCLTASLDIVAIHHYGTKENNRGVRSNSILELLQISAQSNPKLKDVVEALNF
jgi:hypothetical protein